MLPLSEFYTHSFNTAEVMETMDELNQVFTKYQYVVVESRSLPQSQTLPTKATLSGAGSTLLDLSTPSGNSSVTTVSKELADLGKTLILIYKCFYFVSLN